MGEPVVELFAGIGGLSLGLERAGFDVVAQVEADPFRRSVLAKRFPGAARFDDVRTFDPNPWRGVGISGGFPCTDVSDCGPRTGLAGARSGLWREMVRAIRVVGPPFVLVENVAALLGRGMGDVLGDLAACRYDTEWDCVPAGSLGAPHRRDRAFIVAYPEGERWAEGRLAPLRELSPPGGAGDGDASGGRPGSPGARWSSWWCAEPPVGRVVDGPAPRVDRSGLLAARIAGCGDGVVPAVGEYLGRVVKEAAWTW